MVVDIPRFIHPCREFGEIGRFYVNGIFIPLPRQDQ